MGLIAKERSSGTIELLTTLPIDTKDVILGKFRAALGLVTTGLGLTLVHVLTISLIGYNLDYGVILCGYLGLFFVGALYCSIGIFASSITDNQIVAFIISFVICFFFFILEHILIFIPSFAVEFFQFLGTGYHFSGISRGVIDTRNILYFISTTVIFLRLAIVTMESRKWR
jgi:ABC-2 type transport system permease protein